MKVMAVVLAGGMGKRMKSKLCKVLHPVCGKPMVGHVVEAVREAAAERIVVIVGHGADDVKSYFGEGVEYALQEHQLGTGHAVMQAEPLLSDEEGTTIVIFGDNPLVQASTIKAMLELQSSTGAAATALTATFDNPTGYGRIIRGEDGSILRIVEQKDCTEAEAAISEINAGTYIFDNKKLFAALAKVNNDNAQGEYYLPDVISILREDGDVVQAYCTTDITEAVGVNDRVALSEADRFMRERINRNHMFNGVTITDPSSVYIEADVQIGADTVIYPGTVLRGSTVIGEDCVIGPQADITNSEIGSEAVIKYSNLVDSVVGSLSAVGPYAYLRPGSKLGVNCKIGDFVEIKNASLGDGTKVSHLSYVGDAKVGKEVNIGCGAITVNYDGVNKSVTEIGDHAFVGSNVNLIAPIKIGDGAYVVAGSTLTKDVPAGDMAIARERQVNKEGYADRLRSRAIAKQNQEQQ